MAKLIGTKTIVVDGQTVTVRVFSSESRGERLYSGRQSNTKAMMAELARLRQAIANADKRGD